MKPGTTEFRQQMLTGPKLRLVLVMAAVVVAVGLLWVVRHAEASREPATRSQPVVAVAKVDREDLYREVTIPAEFRPYVEVELHAKVSGYVDQMNVDFGDRVKAGQLLATLEVPELSDELHNAMAAVQKAEADHADAHLIYTRLIGVNQQQPNLVAQQDLDTAEARDHETAAAIDAAKADVAKYQTLLAYTQITAPFDGVITWRYADPGALIEAGTAAATQAKSLLRISDNYHLRLDFPVSVEYVKDIHLGDKVDVRVESLGGKSFTGTISRFTARVAEDTRTMITELEVINPNLELEIAEVDTGSGVGFQLIEIGARRPAGKRAGRLVFNVALVEIARQTAGGSRDRHVGTGIPAADDDHIGRVGNGVGRLSAAPRNGAFG